MEMKLLVSLSLRGRRRGPCVVEPAAPAPQKAHAAARPLPVLGCDPGLTRSGVVN